MSPKQRRGRVMVQAPDGADAVEEQAQPIAPDTTDAFEQQSAEVLSESEIVPEAETEPGLSASYSYGPQRAFGFGADSASLDEALRAAGQRIAVWSELLHRWLMALAAWVEVELERARVASGPQRRRYAAWQRRALRQAGIAAGAGARRAGALSRRAGVSIVVSLRGAAGKLRRAWSGRATRERSDGQRRRFVRTSAGKPTSSVEDEEVLAPVSLRDIALEAWQARQVSQTANLEEQRAFEAERDAAALRQLLAQRLGIRSAPTGSHVEVDGIVFGVHWDRPARIPDLVIVGSCPKCGAPVASGDVFDLADLGAVLDDIVHKRNLCEECRASLSAGGPANEAGGMTSRTDGEIPTGGLGGAGRRAMPSTEEAITREDFAPIDGQRAPDHAVAAQAARIGPALDLGSFAPHEVLEHKNGVEGSAHSDADA